MTRDPLDIDGNAAEATRQREAREASFELRVELLTTMVRTPEGRRFVWMIIKDAGVFEAHDGLHELESKGRRSVGLIWLHLMHATPELFAFYPQMVQENHFA